VAFHPFYSVILDSDPATLDPEIKVTAVATFDDGVFLIDGAGRHRLSDPPQRSGRFPEWVVKLEGPTC
jgi:hypothetical protein